MCAPPIFDTFLGPCKHIPLFCNMHKYVVSHIETQCLKGFCQELSKCGVAVQRDGGGAKKEMKHAFVRRQGFLYWLGCERLQL